MGLWVIGMGFGARWVCVGMCEVDLGGWGDCLGLGWAWGSGFGLARGGFGIGCGGFWG